MPVADSSPYPSVRKEGSMVAVCTSRDSYITILHHLLMKNSLIDYIQNNSVD